MSVPCTRNLIPFHPPPSGQGLGKEVVGALVELLDNSPSQKKEVVHSLVLKGKEKGEALSPNVAHSAGMSKLETKRKCKN